MSNFDSLAERTAIFDRLKTLNGGNVWRGIPDDAVLPRFGDGKVRPYVVVKFGKPVPAGRGRSLGGETVQPHILPVSVLAVASASVDAETLSGAITNKLLGWTPGVNNAGELTGGGGSDWTTLDSAGAPSRWTELSLFTCQINLSPVFL